MSSELQILNFKIAIQSWIDIQKNHLSQIDKNVDPISFRHVENNLKVSQGMLYDLTGRKSQAFKELLCSE